jgi:hypothetical protein
MESTASGWIPERRRAGVEVSAARMNPVRREALMEVK